MKQIYIADDEPHIRALIEMYLTKEGYRTSVFTDGVSLLTAMARNMPDLLVLDIGMPGLDGLSVCREIRKTSDLPIIFVTARDEEIDRILGLEIGGDDYLTKPFSPRELVVRIRNIFKRMDKPHVETEMLRVGGLTADGARRSICTSSGDLKLTVKEYDLLEFMMRHVDVPFTRDQLLEKVWGYDYPGDLRAIDDLVKRLRRKMKDGNSDAFIETVWGYGYKITQQP